MKTLLSILFLGASFFTFGQKFELQNPSFEDEPRFAQPPSGWDNCGQAGETPVDIHPTGVFGVTTGAVDGDTYVGMVTRDNGTWEAIGQPLAQALEKGKCYALSLYAARSAKYTSVSRKTNKSANYNKPVTIRMWGGQSQCDRGVLLAVSPPVSDDSWNLYTFYFQPKVHCPYLTIEAYYADSPFQYYNGNVLIDRASPIEQVSCDDSRRPVVPELTPPAETDLDMAADFPELADAKALAAFITDHAPGIQFVNDLPVLEKWSYTDLNGNQLEKNYYLHLIAEVMRDFPDLSLRIAIDDEAHGSSFARLRSELEKALADFNAPNNIRIEPWKAGEKEEDWQAHNDLLYFLLDE